MERLQVIRNLRPYFKIAEQEAKKSPCTRRQYGCVIVWESNDIDNFIVGANYRLSDCCNGVCARTRFDTAHGGRVEIGAEVHAETAALIKAGFSGYVPEDKEPISQRNPIIILAGYMGGKELRGFDVYSCHTCSLNLKFAGFKYIYIKDDDDMIIPVTVQDMIERREKEWENIAAVSI